MERSRHMHIASCVLLITCYLCTVINGTLSTLKRRQAQCPCDVVDTYVDCSGRSLDSIPSCIPVNVIRLNFGANRLTTITRGMFEKLKNVKTLDLQNNRISHVEDFAFAGMHNLYELNLGANMLTTITRRMFVNLTKVQSFDLRDNRISHIEDFAFAGMHNLYNLDLHSNNLTTVTRWMLGNLTKVNTFDLRDNRISHIEDFAFAGMRNLFDLNLGANMLTTITRRMFDKLTNVYKLQLRNNRISYIEDFAFAGMHKLYELDLHSNNLGLTTITRRMLGNLTKVNTLHLHDNNLKTITREMFGDLTSIQTIYLHDNKLKTIPRETFADLTSIRLIDLRHNVGLQIHDVICAFKHKDGFLFRQYPGKFFYGNEGECSCHYVNIQRQFMSVCTGETRSNPTSVLWNNSSFCSTLDSSIMSVKCQESDVSTSSAYRNETTVETTTSAAEVTTSHGHHDITCTESRMEFSIPLSSPHTSETATLSDPNCQINVTRTHVRGGVDLNSCGTTVQFQNDSVIFRNAIIFSAPESSSLGSSGSNDSVSQYQDIIPIQCVYNRIATVHLSYMPVVRRVLFTESGVGQFSFNIQQFWDASFTNMVSDRAYPLRMELDADVFIQLSVGSEGQPVAGHKEIGMEVQQCLVSPSSSVIEAQLHYYPLIQDGCPASSDVHIIPNTNASDSTVMRFRFRAVNFFDPSSSSSSSLVFVHCRMGLCLTGSCKPSAWSCLTPPARRVRRDVDQSKRAAHQLSTGPFLIMADEASTSSSSTTATVMAVVSTSVATVAIVIAAIALIALRRRRTTERN